METAATMTYLPCEVASPGEWEESDGCDVMDKHLNKIFSLDITELRYGQWPVEGKLYHVIPPNGSFYLMVGVIFPKMSQS